MNKLEKQLVTPTHLFLINFVNYQKNSKLFFKNYIMIILLKTNKKKKRFLKNLKIVSFFGK